MLSAKAQPGLIVMKTSKKYESFSWYHGELYVTTETNAKAFSKALAANNLVDAPAGDRRVRELFNETFPDLANRKWKTPVPLTRRKLAASKKLVEDFRAKAAAAALPSPQSSLTSSGAVAQPQPAAS